MGKSNYFLVVKRRGREDFKILELDGVEGNKKSLATIDLYTTGFQTEAEFIMDLYDKKIIDYFDADIFIAKRNNNELSFFEVIYGKDNPYIEKLRCVARAKQQEKINLEVANIDSILDEFCRKMYFNDTFSDMVTYEMTDVYKKFSDYFKRNFASLQAMCGVKYLDGSWARKSYPLIRNVVESFTRYAKMDRSRLRHEIDDYNFYDYNNKERRKISGKLLRETDSNFFTGQISLFDYCATKETNGEEQITEVLEMIQKIPRKAIKEENGEISFNDKVFVYYENPLYRERLMSFLNPVIGRIIYSYLCSGKDSLKDENSLGKIAIQLKNDSKILADMYSFCKLYCKCYEDDYEFCRLHGMLGDEGGKIFRKQESN